MGTFQNIRAVSGQYFKKMKKKIKVGYGLFNSFRVEKYILIEREFTFNKKNEAIASYS